MITIKQSPSPLRVAEEPKKTFFKALPELTAFVYSSNPEHPESRSDQGIYIKLTGNLAIKFRPNNLQNIEVITFHETNQYYFFEVDIDWSYSLTDKII